MLHRDSILEFHQILICNETCVPDLPGQQKKRQAKTQECSVMSSTIRPLWSPLLAGVLLGLVLLMVFALTGHGLGATGLFTRLTAWIGQSVAPELTAATGYLGGMVADGANPLDSWITWQVIGVAIGALAAATAAGRFRVQVDGSRRIGLSPRLALALLGGVIAGFGSRLAAGCTSGLGLSGSATLAVAGFLFLIAFFTVGLALGYLMRRAW
ncbi:MAG: YeeE/YedE thiosulfate transporter family protein [Halothiobacillaceae bacterium]